MTKSAREAFESYLVDTLKVPHGTIERFDIYHSLLKKWQKQINLTAGNEDIWIRHFLDSVQLAEFIKHKDASIIDLGSGAGFPGLPLAMVGYSNICLVESDKKKTIFLKEVARATHTNIEIKNTRIEALENNKTYDYVTARACAPLHELLNYAFPLVSHGTACLFLKGKKYAMEIEEAKNKWLFDFQVLPSITSDDGVVLTITNLKPRAKQ